MASSSNNVSTLDFLKGMAKSIGGGAVDYVKSTMPTTSTTISDASTAMKEVNAKLRTTSSDVTSRMRQMRQHATMRNLMNWFTDKEDEYDDTYGSDDIGNWDDGTSSAEIAESQISEAKANANQISGAIVESMHKSIEANISLSASISASVDKQTATIAAGFDKIDGSLNKILEVLAKNTSAIIETSIRRNESPVNGVMGNGGFDFSSYLNMIKDNVTKTEAGSLASMAMSMMQIAGSTKITPRDVTGLLIRGGMSKFAPNVGKNLEALDSAVSDVITQSLIRLGNSSGQGGLKGTFASIFGIDASRKDIDTSRSEISLKSTPFDTVTKEAITSAIPGYLRKILVAVGGKDEIYDYRSRSFRSQRAMVSEFRDKATESSIRAKYGAPQKLRSAIGNDDWTNMVYDLMIEYIGSELGPHGRGNDIVKNMNDPKFVESMIMKHLIGGKASKYDKHNAKIFANRLSNLNDPMIYGNISMQAAQANLNRNTELQKYVDYADAMSVDLSSIKDDLKSNMSHIKKMYGRNDVSSTDSSISSKTNDFSSGVNYTNSALYAIFRRLDEGINVFQVGSDHSRKTRFKKFGKRYLKSPSGYRDVNVETSADTSGQENISSIAGEAFTDEDNQLRNNVDENGSQENLSRGQRFVRWGKYRGRQFANAMISGSPEDVKNAFVGTVKDISGVASDAMKNGISTINSKFGNISGYLGHKMFGNEYSYDEVDPNDPNKKVRKTIGKNEKGGIFGFVTDKVKSMFDIGKDKASNWFSEVSGYFDYRDTGNKDRQVASKRKKLLHASVGAMAGAGLLGGPLGIIMGAVAGNAIGDIPNIGSKLKEKLFGKDKETGKPTGLISKMGDAIVTPIQYQFGKTMSFVGDKLKKNLLGPLSDIGYVLKNRITSKASSVFGKFFQGMLHGGAKLLGGMGKAGAALIGGIVNAGGSATRGKIGAASAVTGFGLNRIADLLSIGTPGLHSELGDRRNERNRSIEENSERGKFSSFKEFRKQKWARNKDDISQMEEYTKEQVISTKEIEDSNSRIAENSNRTVELLTDIRDNLSGNSKSSSTSEESTVSGTRDNIIQFPGNKTAKELEKEDNSEFGENLIVAGTTAAALSGFSESETRDIDEMARATNRGEQKSTIFGKFKSILKKNQESADAASRDGEKSEETFIDKLFGGIGNLIGKYWPYLLGALALLSDNFRGALTDVGSWLLGNLPSVLDGAGNVAEAGLRGLDNAGSGSKTISDPVTKEKKQYRSAESIAEMKQTGEVQSAVKETFSLPTMAKNGLLIEASRAGVRGAAHLTGAAGKLVTATGVTTNIAANTSKVAGAFTRTARASVSANGFGGAARNVLRSFQIGYEGGGVREGFSQVGRTLTGGKVAHTNVGRGAMSAGQKVSQFGTKTRELFANPKQGLRMAKDGLYSIDPSTGKVVAGGFANFLGGMTAGIAGAGGAEFGWNTMENIKTKNIVGDYGFGNAGGQVRTSNKVKTATTVVSSIGATAVAGGALSSAIASAAAAIAAAAAGTATTGVGAPIALVLVIVAGIVAIAAAFAALVNWIAGLITDKNDQDYAVRSNASKMQGVIDGRVSYKLGADNPIYVYCGRESDRVLGLTKGLNISEPDVVFGRYFKTLVDGLASSPGAEVLLYDWINNMAVQGVPFACYLAGDSAEAPADGAQANSSSTGTPPTDRSGPLGGKYTRVKKSTVKRNKDAIFADISANINRQNPDLVWSIKDLEDLYNYGKEVVDELKKKGILDGDGKVQTKKFKGHPGGKKNADGWKGLEELCRSHDMYFLTKCLVYINSKIEADKDTGQQWLEIRKDDLQMLFENVMDVLKSEHDELVSDLKSQGLSDREVEDRLKEMADPKGPQAAESATLSTAEDPLISSVSGDIKSKDVSDIRKEIQYIAAAYAYSHPQYLEHWVAQNIGLTDINVDEVSKIHNWDTWGDKRKRKTLRNKMKNAALTFGQNAGDIYNLLPQFDWSSDGKIYGKGSKYAEKYGAAFVLRGQKKGAGKGILDSIFGDPTNDITPDEVHDELYGRITHGKGAEAETASAQDLTVGGNGVLARIAEKISEYGSEESQSLLHGDSKDLWRNILVNMPARSPVNLPDLGTYDASQYMDLSGSSKFNNDTLRDHNSKTKNNTDGVGGEVSDEVMTLSGMDAGAKVASDAPKEQSSGGNPLVGKNFKITSAFGTTKGRPHSGAHKGVDLVPADGSGQAEVGSRFSGTVVDVKNTIPDSVRAKKVNGSWKFPYDKSMSTGNMVSIRTDDGMIIKNMHLKAGSIPANITPGAHVNVGDRIGTMGSTGWSTGNHLHYEFRGPGNELLDPTDSLSGVSEWNANASVPTYVPMSEDATVSGYSADVETTNDSGAGPLMTLINKLKEAGNQFLYNISGGLIGSDSSASADNDISNIGTVKGSSSTTMDAMKHGTYLTGRSNSTWITIVRDVKKLVAEQRPSYNQSGYITINYKNRSLKVRTDCTGIICAMLKYYGVLPENSSLNSSAMLSGSAIPEGFDLAPFPGWDNLVEGDILVTNGHAEVFAKNEGNSHYVYNGGSTNALCTPGATKSGHKSYSKIWRCRESVTEDATFTDASSIQASSASSVYNKLLKMGYSEAAASGIIGVWQAESKNNSKTVEGDYIKDYPGYSTVMTDNNSLNEYTTGFLFPAYKRINMSIKESAYAGKDGNYYPGIGLAQWTGPRHYNLKQYAESKGKDWRNEDTQLEFMEYERSQRKITDEFKQMENPEQAAELFARNYEGTSNKNSLNKRAAYAKEFYESHKRDASENANSSISDPLSNTDGMGGAIGDGSLNVMNSSIGSSRYNSKLYTNQQISRDSISSTLRYNPMPTRETQDFKSVNANNAEMVELLREVLVELRSINGNTGNSNALLKTIGENGIADKDLRNQLSSIKPRSSSGKTTVTTKGPNSVSNTRMIASMIRP